MKPILFLLILASAVTVLADTKSDAALDKELGLLSKPWNLNKRVATTGVKPATDPRAGGQPFVQQPDGAIQPGIHSPIRR